MTDPAAAPAQPGDYEAEVRFGVVMYGGVSLAIYINGVADEMYQMACATPRQGYLLPTDGEPATRAVYRRLSWLAGNRRLLETYAAALKRRRAARDDVWDEQWTVGQPRTRLVVDTIAGTSAGGINGVFLAKALANGEEFAPLRQMWIDEGDIGLLLNDRESYQKLSIDPPSGPPKSLLNSDRMYLKLRQALHAMAPVTLAARPAGAPASESPFADRVDLFVTTTDIKGATVPLRLLDQVVYEHRYKHSFHFAYPEGAMAAAAGSAVRNDFALGNEAFLAFAARCTSSFPFAFEPMTLAAVPRLAQLPAAQLGRWDAFFAGLPEQEVALGEHHARAFGDGGYLDNKPFSYVVKSLAEHFADVPVQRKLLYIEPSPEQPATQHPSESGVPNALANSAAALLTIPRAETIREDLQEVLSRNRRIERIERIAKQTEVEVERPEAPFAGVVLKDGKVPAWTDLTQQEILKYYGLAFLSYRRLRIDAATDQVAYTLGKRWGVDRNSDDQYAVRALVRAWREAEYDDEGGNGKPTINSFLEQYDHDYRIRRAGFLMRKVDQLTNLFRLHRDGRLGGSRGHADELSDSDRVMLKTLRHPVGKGFDLQGDQLAAERVGAALAALAALKIGLRDARDWLLTRDRRALDDVRLADAADAGHWGRLQGDVRETLDVLLGKPAARDSGADVERSTIDLHRVEGASVSLRLNGEQMRRARRARVLQEGVFVRAKALFRAATASGAANTAPLVVLKSLEDTLQMLSIPKRPLPKAAPVGAGSAGVFSATWRLLGYPQLQPPRASAADPSERGVHLEVADADPRRRDGAPWSELAAPLNTEVGHSLRHFVAQYYERFDSFDQMTFPMYYDTDTGEPAVVDVVRISPIDAVGLLDERDVEPARRKLAGTAVANFGAFFDRRFRVNDIMWGRLDGAERLLLAVLPGLDADTVAVRAELTRLAIARVLEETLLTQDKRVLTGLLCDAMQELPDGLSVGQRLKKLVAGMSAGPPSVREPLVDVLRGLLGEQGLVDYVANERRIDRQPDPKESFRNLARATTISGRMLEGIAKESGTGSAPARWVARIGLILQGMVAVSLPGTLRQRWWAHGVQVLYAFEVVGLLLAFVLGSGDARSLFATALAVTFVVHATTLVIGDAMNGVFRYARIPLALLAIGGLGLALLGAVGLFRLGPYSLLCGAPAAASSSSAASSAGDSPTLACRLAARAGTVVGTGGTR